MVEFSLATCCLRTTLDNSTERLLRLHRRFTEKSKLSPIQA